jgi:uncharacterized protein YeaO (DUF488 family)
VLKVYTARISYRGEDRLDITVKSGDKLFAPTWNLVMGYKNGTITEEHYTEGYLALMRLSYKRNREQWQALLARDSVTLCCYCKRGDFCHRVILAKILEKLGAQYMGEKEKEP